MRLDADFVSTAADDNADTLAISSKVGELDLTTESVLSPGDLSPTERVTVINNSEPADLSSAPRWHENLAQT